MCDGSLITLASQSQSVKMHKISKTSDPSRAEASRVERRAEPARDRPGRAEPSRARFEQIRAYIFGYIYIYIYIWICIYIYICISYSGGWGAETNREIVSFVHARAAVCKVRLDLKNHLDRFSFSLLA